jgi:hypothetical protein
MPTPAPSRHDPAPAPPTRLFTGLTRRQTQTRDRLVLRLETRRMDVRLALLGHLALGDDGRLRPDVDRAARAVARYNEALADAAAFAGHVALAVETYRRTCALAGSPRDARLAALVAAWEGFAPDPIAYDGATFEEPAPEAHRALAALPAGLAGVRTP